MFTSSAEIRDLFRQFEGLKVMIIGDVMIDTYLRGKVDRISPEAPVPVVALQKRVDMLGGSANVALNVKAMGAYPILCSVIGDDAQGPEFMHLLEKENIDRSGIVVASGRITTTKYRIIGNNTQMLRVDHETDADLSQDIEVTLLNTITSLIRQQKPSVIILQDYNKGVLTAGVITSLIQLAKDSSIPVAVDPKKKNFSLYKSVRLFKPNLKEIREGLKIDLSPVSPKSLQAAAEQICRDQQVDAVMITLSEEGVFVHDKDFSGIIQGHPRSVADVSGAGDTVVSVAALCLATGVDAGAMAALANLAGGQVCESVGVVAVNKDALLNEAERHLLK